MGKMQVYDSVLAELKAEPFDRVRMLVVSGDLIKILVAWPSVTRWVETPSEDSDLHQAWNMTRWSARDWASLAHVDVEYITKSWRGIVKANLIYPDGTFPEEVRSLLEFRADQLIGVREESTESSSTSPSGSLN